MAKNFNEMMDSIREYKDVIDSTQDEKGKYADFMRRASEKLRANETFHPELRENAATILKKAADAFELLWNVSALNMFKNEKGAKKWMDHMNALSELLTDRTGRNMIWTSLALTPYPGLDKAQMIDDMTVVGKVLGFPTLSEENFQKYSHEMNVSKEKFVNRTAKKSKKLEDDFVVIDMDENKNVIEREDPKKNAPSKFVLKDPKKKEEPKKEEPKKEEPKKEEPVKEAPVQEAPKQEFPDAGYPSFDDDGPIELPEELQKYADKIHDPKAQEEFNNPYPTFDDEPIELPDELKKYQAQIDAQKAQQVYEDINAVDDVPQEEAPQKEEPKKEEPKKEEPKKEEPKNEYEKALATGKENYASVYEDLRAGVQKFANSYQENLVHSTYLKHEFQDINAGRVGERSKTYSTMRKMILIGLDANEHGGWSGGSLSGDELDQLVGIRWDDKDISEIHATMTASDVKRIANDPMEMTTLCMDYQMNHGMGRDKVAESDKALVERFKQMKKDIVGGKTNGSTDSTDKLVEKLQDTIEYLSRPADARFNMEIRKQKLEELGLAAQGYIDHKKSEVKDQKKVNKPGWEPSSSIGKTRYRHSNTLLQIIGANGIDMSKAKGAADVQPYKVKVNTDRYEWLDHMASMTPNGKLAKPEYGQLVIEAVAGMFAASMVEHMKSDDKEKYLYNAQAFNELQHEVYASKAFKSIAKDAVAGVVKGDFKELYKLQKKAMTNNGQDLIEKFQKDVVKNKENIAGAERLAAPKAPSKGMKK